MRSDKLIEQFEKENPIEPMELKEAPAGNTRREIGFSGLMNVSGYNKTDEYNLELKEKQGIKVFRKMRMSDAQINATCLSYELPIRAGNWIIESASNDNADIEIRNFIEDQLFNNLNFTFDSFLKNILKYMQFGFYLFEKVLMITEENKIGLKKMAVRRPETIDRFLIDDTGTLNEVEQFAANNTGGFGRVKIPNSKILLFVNDQEGNNYKGLSYLRSVHPNWKIKQLLLKIDAIKHERQGLGVPFGKLPESEQEGDAEKLIDILENMRAHQKQYVVWPHGFEFGFMDMKAGSTSNIMDSIKFHNQEISNNILSQFMQLGQTESGTYALAEQLKDMFTLSLLATSGHIAGVINGGIEGRTLIRELVDMNFANVKKYPKLKATKIHQVDYEKLAKTLSILATSKIITTDEELEKFVRSSMDAPVLKELSPDEREKQIKEKKAARKKIDIQSNPEENKAAGVKAGACDHNHVEFSEREPGQYWRPLTSAETEIKLVEIDKNIRNYRDLLIQTGNKYKNQMIKFLVERGSKLLVMKYDIDAFEKAINETRLPLTKKLESEFYKVLKDLYKWSGDKVREELTKVGVKFQAPIPKDPDQAVKTVGFLARLAIRAIIDKLTNEWKGEIINQRLVGEVATDRLRERLTSLSENIFKNEMQETANQTFGIGRATEAMKVKDQIKKVIRSEVMDENTCKPCEAIDEQEYDIDDPALDDFIAGGYINCEGGPERCRGINIFRTEGD
jgi:hypothetical protein